MMWDEFEGLAGYSVSYKDYNEIIEPMYMATRLSKAEFVKCLDRKRFEVKPPKIVKAMRVRNRLGKSRTPNGAYYYIEYVELVKIDIGTGKYHVKPLREDDFKKLSEQGKDLSLSSSYDMDYTQCVDYRSHKPVCLLDW